MSEPINEVHLAGRVTSLATERELPSGDTVATFRLAVARPDGKAGVDTIDCAAWRANLRRTAGSWQIGDEVDLTGELRRRFWRGPAGVASRYEVEVIKARRTAKAAS